MPFNEHINTQRQLLKYPVMTPQLPSQGDIRKYFEEIDQNRWYTNFGPISEKFRQALADHFSALQEHICLMSSGTSALTACLQESADRVPQGFCILPSWTFVATAHAVRLSGLSPYFIDVDEETGQITPELAAAALKTVEAAAVIPVSPFGAPVDPGPWEAFQKEYDVNVVIDAAAGFDSAKLSLLPTVVSLHATKIVSSGEGAFVMCSDPVLIERLRRRSNFGFGSDRISYDTGLNAKMSEYHAAVGLASLSQLLSAREKFMEAARSYRRRLHNVTGADFQQGWGENWISSTCNIRTDETPDVEALIAKLALSGIEARTWWRRGCHLHPAFSGAGKSDLTVTGRLARQTIGLPFSVSLTDDDIAEIAAALTQSLGR